MLLESGVLSACTKDDLHDVTPSTDIYYPTSSFKISQPISECVREGGVLVLSTNDLWHRENRCPVDFPGLTSVLSFFALNAGSTAPASYDSPNCQQT